MLILSVSWFPRFSKEGMESCITNAIIVEKNVEECRFMRHVIASARVVAETGIRATLKILILSHVLVGIVEHHRER
ncbi:MAG: hypothetical protein A2294_02310 [Candidatus Magasanikbacteria bacterium RIFOXYB2_FULL_38_10]|nr:MAG: hypothetical protein A2294_02310 [Candidatus Magasanikbacteria bacterium RIFOXYB2_FULL_38_10]